MLNVFKRLLILAGRNMLRNKRRAIQILLVLTLGSSGLILVGGFFLNIMDGFRDGFIHSQTGHLQVNKQGFFRKGVSDPSKYLIQDIDTVRQIIELNPNVHFTVPRLALSGTVSAQGSSIPVIALGVDPIAESRMGSGAIIENSLNPAIKIVAGKDLDPQDPNGAILGQGLLKALGLKIGDSVFFMTAKEGGSINGAEFIIRGAFETIVKDFDDQALKVNLAKAQELWQVPDQVHSLLVVLDKTENTQQVKVALEKKFQKANLGLEVIPWTEQALYYRQAKDMMNKVYGTIQLILVVVLFFSIANTLNMSLFERMREFGTMMAIGNSRVSVFMTVFLEAVLLGLLGSILGVAFGCLIAQVVSAVGIKMPPPPNATSSFYVMISLTPKIIFQSFGITLAAAIFSSLLPSYRASHLPITKALGYV